MHARRALQGSTLPSTPVGLTLPPRAASVAIVLVLFGLMLFGCAPRVAPFSPQELGRLQDERNSLQELGYRIEPGDTLVIRYPFHPEMDQEPMPNDVIFVPRTPIVNVNVWVRQHITELIPFLRTNLPISPGR